MFIMILLLCGELCAGLAAVRTALCGASAMPFISHQFLCFAGGCAHCPSVVRGAPVMRRRFSHAIHKSPVFMFSCLPDKLAGDLFHVGRPPYRIDCTVCSL